MHCSIHVPLGFAFCDGMSLVELLATLSDPDQDLGSATGKVDFQRHKGRVIRVLSPSEFDDLPLMSQELSGPDGLMLTMRTRRRIFPDVHSLKHQRRRIRDRPDPTFRQTRLAGPN